MWLIVEKTTVNSIHIFESPFNTPIIFYPMFSSTAKVEFWCKSQQRRVQLNKNQEGQKTDLLQILEGST